MLLGLRARLTRRPLLLVAVVVALGLGLAMATAHSHPAPGAVSSSLPLPGDSGPCGPGDALCAVALLGLMLLLTGRVPRAALLLRQPRGRWSAPSRARPPSTLPVLVRLGRLQI